MAKPRQRIAVGDRREPTGNHKKYQSRDSGDRLTHNRIGVIMGSSHRAHYFHLVWSTKGRQDFILPKVQERLYPYMGGIVRKSGGVLLEIGGIPNHVHILVGVSNLDHFTALVRNTKASSSGWLKEEFPECLRFGWQDGFGSFTVSYSMVDTVREYTDIG